MSSWQPATADHHRGPRPRLAARRRASCAGWSASCARKRVLLYGHDCVSSSTSQEIDCHTSTRPNKLEPIQTTIFAPWASNRRATNSDDMRRTWRTDLADMIAIRYPTLLHLVSYHLKSPRFRIMSRQHYIQVCTDDLLVNETKSHSQCHTQSNKTGGNVHSSNMV